MTVNELSVAYIGQRIRVTTKTDEVTGVLYGINVKALRIDDARLWENEPNYVAGAPEGTIKVGSFKVPVFSHTVVEVLS